MNPTAIVGFLGWLGWGIGILAGLLQFQSWRQERRLGPAKQQLFEEALRDRQGQYSEEQITELSELVRKLEISAKTEIPRQARRVFLEGQLEAIEDDVAASVRQHEQVRHELAQLKGESQVVPRRLSAAIDSSMLSPSVERRRQVRRIYLLAMAIAVFIVYPGLLDYIGHITDDFFGGSFLIFGGSDVFSYIAGAVVTFCVAFSLPAHKAVAIIRRHPTTGLITALMLILVWLICVVYIAYRNLHPVFYYDWTDEVSIFSLAALSLSVRILRSRK